MQLASGAGSGSLRSAKQTGTQQQALRWVCHCATLAAQPAGSSKWQQWPACFQQGAQVWHKRKEGALVLDEGEKEALAKSF